MKYVESMHMELKEIVTPEIKKEIVAFANTEGGIIFIGISDDGTILGIDNIDQEMERVGNMIRDGILPDLTRQTKVELVKEDDLNLIKITVQSGVKKPYHLIEKGLKTSGVYVRHGVSSVPASEESIREFIKETDGTVYDQARCINQDLTFSYAEYIFKSKNLSFESANKKSLGFVDADGFYTNTALLFSDQCEHSIKCAVFCGDNKLVFKARKQFSGSLLKQLDDALTYLDMYSNENTEIHSLTRVDYPDYPKAALREALINAIVHRDYSYSGSILVNIYDERLEILSLGSLVKGLTKDDILSGVSQTRNELIANVFYRLEYIESYGTGIQRIMEIYRNAQYKPLFKLNPASFILEIPKYKKKTSKNDSKEEIVFRRIKEEGRITRKEVEELLSCSSFTANRVLNNLLKDFKIQSFGAARSTYYKQA